MRDGPVRVHFEWSDRGDPQEARHQWVDFRLSSKKDALLCIDMCSSFAAAAGWEFTWLQVWGLQDAKD